MPFVFKPTSVKPIPKSAVIKAIDGVRCACWTNRRNRKVVAELTEDGKRCRAESPTWWVEYTTATGTRNRRKGFRDKAATMKLGYELESQAEDVRSGRASGRAPTGQDHLDDHLPAFREYVEGKGRALNHTRSVMHNVKAVIDGCDLTAPATVDCERVARWLANERKREGWSAENVNRYVIFLRMFGKWLVKTQRATHNPFDGLSKVESNGETTRQRRRLGEDELAGLIAAARTAAKPLLSLSGPDRARLYTLAAFTGLRCGTLAKLTPEAFTWHDDLPASVTASGRLTKNKKPHTVPIHPDVAADLAEWLRDRSRAHAGKPIFPKGGWARRAADLVKHDLAVAREKWIGEAADEKEKVRRELSDVLKRSNAAGEVFDFHALRVQFISGLALSGVPLTAAQQLADHSTPTLTANIYTRWGPAELAGEVAKLPGLRAATASGLQSPLHASAAQDCTTKGSRENSFARKNTSRA